MPKPKRKTARRRSRPPEAPSGGFPIRLNIPRDTRVRSIPAPSTWAPPVDEYEFWWTPERIPPPR